MTINRPSVRLHSEAVTQEGEGDLPLGAKVSGEVVDLPVEMVRRGAYQPRRQFNKEKLLELANSIEQKGVVQPIIVRSSKCGKYEIVAGERRWRAAQLAGLHEIPSIIKEWSDKDTAEIALIENLQREDLTAIEIADALKRLGDEFDYTQEQLALHLGENRSTIGHYLGILLMAPETKRLMHNYGDKITFSHAKILKSVRDPDNQVRLAKKVVLEKVSVSLLRRKAKILNGDIDQKPTKRQGVQDVGKRDPNIVKLEQELQDKTGAITHISYAPGGKWKLEFEGSSLDELDGVLERIK